MGQAVLQVVETIDNRQADTNSTGNPLFYLYDMCGQVLPTNIHFLLCFVSDFIIRGSSLKAISSDNLECRVLKQGPKPWGSL